MVQKDDAREHCQDEDQGDVISRLQFHLAHAGPAFIAVVAAALHGVSQFVRSAETRDEQRDEDWDEGAGPLEDVARFEVRPSRLLRARDLVGLIL